MQLRGGQVTPHTTLHEAMHALAGAGWDKDAWMGPIGGAPAGKQAATINSTWIVEGLTEMMTRLVLDELGFDKDENYYSDELGRAWILIQRMGWSEADLARKYFANAAPVRDALIATAWAAQLTT